MTPELGCWKSKALETQCFTEGRPSSSLQSQQAYLFFQGLFIIEY